MWRNLLLKTRWKLFNSTRKTGAMAGLLHTFHRVFNLWKNYRAFTECIDVFCGKLLTLAKRRNCTPYTDLVTAVEKTKGTNIHVGAENVHFEKSGAFTGEISADMLVDLGVEYVIVGHSERRQYFAETDQTVNKRALAALNAGLKVIICVGESLQQREEGVTEELVRMQTKIALRDVTAEQMANVVIAYEPIWAIGTGKTATADQAEEVCAQIRKVIGEVYGEAVAEATTVQYGGSMNAKNCEELLSKKDVDGGLIGGASLKAPDFAVIVNAASNG